MQLSTIIGQIKAHCSSFTNRVAGAAEFKSLQEATALPVPCAFVIPLDDNPEASKAMNSVRIPMTDSFAVIVALSNTTDEKGQTATDGVHSIRAEIWAALLGFRPSTDYNGIEYQGGSLLSMDRARLWYQFEFGAEMEIGPADGWQDIDLAAQPHLDRIDIKIIEPAGTAEPEIMIPKTGTLP